MASKAYDPKAKVEITKVDKRGDHHHVEGYAEGRKVSIVVPEPSLRQFKTTRDGEAYLRRSLLGTKRMEDNPRG